MITEGLLASKICHDLANRLTSVICAKEELSEQNCNLQDLSNALELTSLNLIFFQNITVQASHIANLYDILIKIGKLANITINIDFTSNEDNNYHKENIICGLIYIIVSNSIKTKRQTEINVKFDNKNATISIEGFELENLPQALQDILSPTALQVNNINAFAMYIKKIIDANGYVLLLKEDKNRTDLFIRKIN